MADPRNYFTQEEIDRNRYIIEEKPSPIFAPNARGGCGTTAQVAVCANERICIYWQITTRPIPYRQILLAADWIGKYILYGGFIMDYDPTQLARRIHTGRDGITRRWCIEANSELCNGYGGAAYNGGSWCAISQDSLMVLTNTVDEPMPTIPQVIFYEVGRCVYNLKLDRVLEWQLNTPEQYGYWALGWNGAMTAVAPGLIGAKMDYYGMDAERFKNDRLNDLNQYVRNTQYTFRNTWSAYLLPWSSNQSVNDLMSGLLIHLYYEYGGAMFLYYMFYYLTRQPDTYTMIQREQKANNLVRSCYLAVRELFNESKANEIHLYFFRTLRWTFLGPVSRM